MLGNRNENEKNKNQLVFKLLKSMDPFFPQNKKQDQMRSQLLAIIKQNTSSIIPQEDTILEEQQESIILQKSRMKIKDVARNIASQVFNITIHKGSLYESSMKMQKTIQSILTKQMQAEKQSKIVRQDIINLQGSTFKKFNIKFEDTETKHYKPFPKPSGYNTLVNKKLGSSNQEQRYKQLINISSARTASTFDPNFAWISERQKKQTPNTSQNQYYQDHQREKTNANNDRTSPKIASNKFSEIRNQLQQMGTPSISRLYRHQSDINRKTSNFTQFNNKSGMENKQMSLGLQSILSNKSDLAQSKIIRSKSELVINRKQMKNKKVQSNIQNSQRSMSSSKIYNSKSARRPSQYKNESKKCSQKILIQSQKLDMQIMASILHRKISDIEKSNTIAFLIK